MNVTSRCDKRPILEFTTMTNWGQMSSQHPEPCCKRELTGILCCQDIFGEYVEPVTGFQPTKGQLITVQPGERIFSSGEMPVSIQLIRTGKALLIHRNSKSIPIHAPEDGEPVFGIVESLCSTTYDADLTAVTECSISVLSPDELFGHIRRSPALSFRLAEVVAGLYIRMVRKSVGH